MESFEYWSSKIRTRVVYYSSSNRVLEYSSTRVLEYSNTRILEYLLQPY